MTQTKKSTKKAVSTAKKPKLPAKAEKAEIEEELEVPDDVIDALKQTTMRTYHVRRILEWILHREPEKSEKKQKISLKSQKLRALIPLINMGAKLNGLDPNKPSEIVENWDKIKETLTELETSSEDIELAELVAIARSKKLDYILIAKKEKPTNLHDLFLDLIRELNHLKHERSRALYRTYFKL